MVGNANEISESIDVLQGEGPDDLVQITKALAHEMLTSAGLDDVEHRVDEALTSGAALDKFVQMVQAQGGDPKVVEDRSILDSAPEQTRITADRSGVVARCDARSIGLAAGRVGAGRGRKEGDIDPGVGIEVLAKVGDAVDEGEVLGVLHHRPCDITDAMERARSAWDIAEDAVSAPPLVIERIS